MEHSRVARLLLFLVPERWPLWLPWVIFLWTTRRGAVNIFVDADLSARATVAFVSGCLISSTASGGYALSIDQRGGPEFHPGDAIVLDVILESSSGLDRHNSAIFWMVFSAVGLQVTNYAWGSPFTTGGILDQSTAGQGGGPLTIDSSTFDRPGDGVGLIDLEFSNVLLTGAFTSGVLLSVELAIPDTFTDFGVVTVAVEADTFADGFDELVVANTGPIELVIVPSAAAWPVLLGSCGFIGRGRRR
jgi:hypothetical protein